ncbi:MAG: hypothetical protein JAZ12_02600 [Candidatus Thiodiazotropha taylori]|nr:hypothetical protein [Candidatus Thiodiazotropha taylori]
MDTSYTQSNTEETRSFRFDWLLIIGVVLVIAQSITTMVELVEKGTIQLSEYGAEALLLKMVRESYFQSILPIQVALVFAVLFPIFSAFHPVTGFPVQSPIRFRYILLRKVRAGFAALFAGVMAGLVTALASAKHGTFQDILSFKEFIALSSTFTVLLCVLLIFSYWQFSLSKQSVAWKRVVITISFIAVSYIGVLAADYAISSLYAVF